MTMHGPTWRLNRWVFCRGSQLSQWWRRLQLRRHHCDIASSPAGLLSQPHDIATSYTSHFVIIIITIIIIIISIIIIIWTFLTQTINLEVALLHRQSLIHWLIYWLIIISSSHTRRLHGRAMGRSTPQPKSAPSRPQEFLDVNFWNSNMLTAHSHII